MILKIYVMAIITETFQLSFMVDQNTQKYDNTHDPPSATKWCKAAANSKQFIVAGVNTSAESNI